MKIDWKRKLTSRKFWIAVATLVSGLVIAFRGTSETAETISGCIMAAASAIAYAIGEGLSDSSHAGTSDQTPAPTAPSATESTVQYFGWDGDDINDLDDLDDLDE